MRYVCRWRQGARSGAAGLLVAGLLACAGCHTQPKPAPYDQLGRRRSKPPAPVAMIDPTKVPPRDDVVEIIQYWPNIPWLYESGRVVGFRVTTYFVSGATEQGAFVSGRIFAWLYTFEDGPDGKRARQIAHVWEFDQAEAMLYRVRKKAVGGYYYGFMLAWPPELELEGRLIEIEFGYERGDGSVITTAPRRYRVPVSADYVPPSRKDEP